MHGGRGISGASKLCEDSHLIKTQFKRNQCGLYMQCLVKNLVLVHKNQRVQNDFMATIINFTLVVV